MSEEVVMPESALGDGLRRLRERGLGRTLTQRRLSKCLGVSAALISSWEAGKVAPPRSRLEDYATFFATPRSLDAADLLDQATFTAEEAERRQELLQELLDAPEQTDLETQDFWSFPDGAPVRIMCGALEDPPAIAHPDDPNFVRLAGFADLDSLMELYAHVRRCNPDSDVRFLLVNELIDDDVTSTHLVLLGNLARMQTAIARWLPPLPVRQFKDANIADGEVFEASGERFAPVAAPDGSAYVEDVGFLARMPNPLDPERTITLCSGVFTRGVYGAVRSTTDQRIAEANTAYLRKCFDPGQPSGMLIRVKVAGSLSPTPRLDDADARLFEFP